MKNLKLIFYTLLLSVITFTSCTNDNIDQVPEPQESAALQTSLDNLRTLYNEDGSPIQNLNPTGNLIFDFCFEFVYPLNLVYNTGTTVTVNSNEELITIILNSTNELYIVGIEFPFDVEVYNSDTNQTEILTINNEVEFIALLESCSFNDPCDCDSEYDPVCVEVGSPNGGTMTITYQNECYALCDGFTPNDFVDCENDCDCPTDYNPVCVEVNGEIIQFDNYCLAECEGYTQQDMVDCENNGDCEIDELEVEVGECNADGTYQITINFEYGETDQTTFDVYLRNDVYFGNFSLDSLPLTIESFQLSGYDEDYIKVCFEGAAGGDNCCEDEEWDAPDCNGNGGDCNITGLEVETGECSPAGVYDLTINFEYENVNGSEAFGLYVGDDIFVGNYPLSSLPLTIENFGFGGLEDGNLEVYIVGVEDCHQEIDWNAPDCDNGGDDCYEFVFPITMFLGGTQVTVNSNEDVDYYLGLGYDLSYPLTIIYNNEAIIVNQGILEGGYGERCD